MKVGEILRKVADQIDRADAKQSAEAMMQQAQQSIDQANSMAQDAADDAMAQTIDQAPEQITVSVDNVDNTDIETMVPPLQQKHELLKKATGVENNVDDFACDDEDMEQAGAVDEIELMKKMAGIGQEQDPRDMADTIRPVSINPRANAAMAHFASDNYDAE